ncbi:peptidase-like protein [Cordyceps javanica]|uniref:Peptide hydrolase n=1 Tax=Cordyceps javanica TaxID=43265 RepID=A0A545UNA7_9HYPO|nr:peptidase-like protein [Cordyceps javanica]TQW02692.1 peptidase-like protein [Cordyceps javanica]
MKFLKIAVLGALYCAGLLDATDPITPEKAANDIRVQELENVLWNLQKIARDNGGNRAHGLPGFKASRDFVLERVVKRFGARLDTYTQEFNHTYNEVRRIELKGPEGNKVDVYTLQYVSSTPLPGGVTAPLLNTPVDDARGSMCFPDQWDGIDASGKVVLLKRGECAIADKLKLAKQHGALAAVLYHNLPGTPTSATLGAGNVGLLVPVALVHRDVGEGWKTRLSAGEDLKVTLTIDAIFEQRPGWNVISETKQGDPNNVVMLGAHLDSVQAGPGINDDGSGTAALLEIVTSFQKYTGFKNKIRFAWWGAEELGLVGSLYYTSRLSEAEKDKIKFYFNYDMIASPEPKFVVYADNDSHEYGAVPIYEYLKGAGAAPEYAKFGSSSDYVGFLRAGIPSSGIFTGAGAPYDQCYHQLCDNLRNINWNAYEKNAKAAAYVAAQFALNLDGVPKRNTTSSNPQSARGIQNTFRDWTTGIQVAETHASCGGELRSV